MQHLRPTLVILTCIAAFLCGCTTPSRSVKLPSGFWIKCPESEASHCVYVDYSINQSLHSQATWFIKRVNTAPKETQPLELISQNIELTRSGESRRDKCESVFSLVAPSSAFPTTPFLLSVSMSWMSEGKSGEFSRLLEVRESSPPTISEKELSLAVTITACKGR